MKQRYFNRYALLIALVGVVVISSCGKKSDSSTAPVIPATNLASVGLYEYQSGLNKRIFIPVAAIGTQTVTTNSTNLPEYLVFDTGSTGLSIDANGFSGAAGIIPASMITTNGFVFTGDSTVVNGITITSKTGVMIYGDAISSIKVYGNVAYASITVGEVGTPQVTAKRVPFFLYYKIVDQNNVAQSAHSADVFGVGSGYSYASTLISSPLSYFDYSGTNGGISGFKLATMNPTFFNSNGTFVQSLLTIGLTPADVNTSGFVLHPLTFINASIGYVDEIPATVVYNTTTVTNATLLFDTGTPSITEIEDPKATGIGPLTSGSTVTVTTNKGFTFNYTVSASGNLTSVQNPNNTKDTRTIFSLDFFIKNEYLVDYKDHEIGLKNN